MLFVCKDIGDKIEKYTQALKWVRAHGLEVEKCEQAKRGNTIH